MAKRPPWKKPGPEKKGSKSLPRSKKRKARKMAREAGRPYPNLVDNMRAAGETKG